MLDINVICRNSGLNFQRTLDCLSEQTFQDFKVTVIDDGSTDGTSGLVKKHAEKDPRFSYTRNEHRLYIGNFQRAFWLGDSEFVMPKSSDDLIDKTYVEKCMARLQEDSELAMVHTGSEVLDDMGQVVQTYDDQFNLRILDDDPLMRSIRMAATYAVAPSYWGVYRRNAVSKLQPIPYCNGFDHIVMCELALYGKTDYIDEILFHRARGGAPLLDNAKKATLHHIRDLPMNSIASDFTFMTPIITMIIGHLDMARVVRIEEELRLAYIDKLMKVLVNRFKDSVQEELNYFKSQFRGFARLATAEAAPEITKSSFKYYMSNHIMGIETVLGDKFDLTEIRDFRHEICKI